MWDVEFCEEFAVDIKKFPKGVQLAILARAKLLEEFGPHLSRPNCDTLNGSKYANMKELRFSVMDGEWRVAFAFDPQRKAIFLAAGSKAGTSQRRFYSQLIQEADDRYHKHLK